MRRTRTSATRSAFVVLGFAVVLGAGACSGADPASVTERTEVGTTADDIPVARTPPGGWSGQMPAPVLAACTEPLVEDAPDLRGLWQVTSVRLADGRDAPEHPAMGARQRIEQCGNRLVVTAGGIIHDMRCDGTEENGVNDVADLDKTTPITVVATYEDGVHVLRPVGLAVEVRRRIEDGRLIWDYLGFTATLDRVD